MDFDCGRMGNLEGVFIADTEDVEYLVNSKICVYFGEVLGKHSEISGCVAESEIKQITTDENVIKIVEEYGLNSGYNPFEYTLCTSEKRKMYPTTELTGMIVWYRSISTLNAKGLFLVSIKKNMKYG